MYYGDPTYFLIIIGIFITLGAQFKINSAYKKYKQIELTKKITGAEVARAILKENNLDEIYVVETKGELTDHYDPGAKTIRLSRDIYNGETIASASVAAHEVGHAIQDKIDYKFYQMRSLLFPVVNFISYLGYIGLIISFIGGLTTYIMMCILVLVATVIFQLVTLPVEFDASRRAGIELEKLGLLTKDEKIGVSKMLGAAALTYVASLVSSLLQLLRLILIFNSSDSRD